MGNEVGLATAPLTGHRKSGIGLAPATRGKGRILMEDGWTEPLISINGVKLTSGQSMAVRVACSTFIAQLDGPQNLGSNVRDHRMRAGYRARIIEVLRIMHRVTV